MQGNRLSANEDQGHSQFTLAGASLIALDRGRAVRLCESSHEGRERTAAAARIEHLQIGEGAKMIDPDSTVGRELKAAEEFFALARTTPLPFMRSYYQRVAERYLSSKGELRAVGPSTSTTGHSPGP
jgi:hypothetical protein